MNPSHAGAEMRSPHDQEDDGESAIGARLVVRRAERTARDLLSEWRQAEGRAATSSIHIDALQLYRLGGLLVQLRDRAHQQTNNIRLARSDTSLHEAAHGLVAVMSARNRSDTFRHLHVGLFQLVRKCQGGAHESSVEPSGLAEDERNVEEAIRVLSELYAVAGEYGPTAADVRTCGSETSPIHERVEGDPVLHPLLSCYANVLVPHKRTRASEAMLKILTRLVWTDRPSADAAEDDDDTDGKHGNNDTALFSVLHTIQAFDAAWCEFVRHQDVRDENWREALVRHHHDADNMDDDQLAYLSSILHAPTSDDADNSGSRLSWRAPSASAAAAAAAATTQAPRASHESELDRRIRQVRQVLPDLGEGFVEAVLSYYQGDVERTVTSLLQEEADGSSNDSTGGLPEALRSLDWTLPRRARRRRSDSRPDLDEDVIAITKSIVRETDRLQEEEAYALERVGVDDDYDDDNDQAQRALRDEYDDDYDDQYDDYQPSVDDKAGVTDDYEAVRLYNRALKSVVREQAYWEEERNTNRPPPRAQQSGTGGGGTSDDDIEGDAGPSKYRGPDKLRGGRVPREHRGGGGGARGRGNAPGRAPGGRGQQTGGRGRGRGGGQRDGQAGRASTASSPNNAATTPDSGAPSQPGRGTRAKANRLSNRRDKQKQAAAKRVG
jgi:CUE domain